MTSEKKACIFCGSVQNKVSKEHVFRSALRKYAPPTDHHIFEDYATGTRRQLTKTLFDQTIRKVCKPCNEGWLHDLEVEVEPALASLIRGHESGLSTAESQALARWAAKTNVVRGHAAPSRAIPAPAAGMIRDHQELSHNWLVALYRYAEPTVLDLLRHFDLKILASPKDGAGPTVHLGKGLVQEHILIVGRCLLYSRFTQHPDPLQADLTHSWNAASNKTQLREAVIWPSGGWPPTTSHIPEIGAPELGRLSSILPAAYQHQTGKVWQGLEFLTMPGGANQASQETIPPSKQAQS